MVSEKVGGAEGTKLDEDFKEMEKKVDLTSKAVTEVLARTTEYLQPNPASRAKLTMLNTMSKIRGQVKNPGYPQSEGLLGETMIRYGKELGEDSNFGDALLDAGESMKRLAEVKDSLDIEVKQNFIDPLQNLCDKDLKEIQEDSINLEQWFAEGHSVEDRSWEELGDYNENHNTVVPWVKYLIRSGARVHLLSPRRADTKPEDQEGSLSRGKNRLQEGSEEAESLKPDTCAGLPGSVLSTQTGSSSPEFKTGFPLPDDVGNLNPGPSA
ncbi:endophilin-A2 isoform X2, partial [Podarcis lilfordi]